MSEPRLFHHDLPPHLIEHGAVSTWRGWYTHEHAHTHPDHVESLNHKPAFSHRHEHRWEPDERHHHAVDQRGSG